MLGHIPWIGRYAKSLPVSMDLKRFRAFTVQRFLLRKSEGSERKDLFYHLVRNSKPRSIADLAFPDLPLPG